MLKKTYYKMGAAMTAGMLLSSADAAHAGPNTFSTIAQNMQISASAIPGLLTALAYLFGLLLAVLGVMKIKDRSFKWCTWGEDKDQRGSGLYKRDVANGDCACPYGHQRDRSRGPLLGRKTQGEHACIVASALLTNACHS